VKNAPATHPPLAFIAWTISEEVGLILAFEVHRTGIRVFALYAADRRDGGETTIDLPISPELEPKLQARAIIAADLLKI
jgi:hypothetical protein